MKSPTTSYDSSPSLPSCVTFLNSKEDCRISPAYLKQCNMPLPPPNDSDNSPQHHCDDFYFHFISLIPSDTIESSFFHLNLLVPNHLDSDFIPIVFVYISQKAEQSATQWSLIELSPKQLFLPSLYPYYQKLTYYYYQ